MAAAVAAGADIPRVAGPIDIVTHRGERLRLADLKGKVVVLEFLLTHCPGCKNSARILSKFQSEYGARGLQVVGLAIDAGAGPKIAGFVQETGANFPIGVYDDGKAREYLQVPMVVRMMMPQVALIDRAGMLREQHSGDDPWMAPAMEETNMRRAIEKLLAAKAAPAAKKNKK